MTDRQLLLTALCKGDMSALPALLDEIGDAALIKSWKQLSLKKRPWVHLPRRRCRALVHGLLVACGYPVGRSVAYYTVVERLSTAIGCYGAHLSHQHCFENNGAVDLDALRPLPPLIVESATDGTVVVIPRPNEPAGPAAGGPEG